MPGLVGREAAVLAGVLSCLKTLIVLSLGPLCVGQCGVLASGLLIS